MLARLWWKEYRTFGPAWLVLVLAVVGLQKLLLTARTEDVRSGSLTVVALVWAVLYAFASGAAAFAGEREAKTLGFLDALPVGRGTLWLGKVSFALASTFGLALVLAGIAAIGTETRDPRDIYGHGELLRVFGTILFEGVAWSLLWSSVSKNPLIAGVMGVLSAFLAFATLDRLLVLDLLPPPGRVLATNDLVSPVGMVVRLLAASIALAASYFVMTRKPSRGSRPSRREPTDRFVPVPLRASSASRSLTWQATREGATTWLLVALMGGMVAFISWSPTSPPDGSTEIFLATLAALVAGVGVFGLDGASNSRRFLVHHGVKAGATWWRRWLAWGLAMGPIFGLATLTFWRVRFPLVGQGSIGEPALVEATLTLACGVADAFAVGLVCGMAIARRITAAMVGVLALIVLVPLQLALAFNAMIPTWGLALVPTILVVISRAWADDWLHQRDGARPWLKLAGLIVVPFGLLGFAFVAYRAFGVPDVGPQFPPGILRAEAIPPEEDAAEGYQSAIRLFHASRDTTGNDPTAAMERVIERGWDSLALDVVEWWKREPRVVEFARNASAKPRTLFPVPLDSSDGSTAREMQNLGRFLALDARERLSRGDLPGAWGDILAQFRMAHHLQTSLPTLEKVREAGALHHRAVRLAFDWLRDPRQSREVVGKALADLKGLPEPPNLVQTIQVESALLEQMLDLSGAELTSELESRPGGRQANAIGSVFLAWLVAPLWERSHARRVGRQLIHDELSIASLPPWERASPIRLHPDGLAPGFQGSPLLRRVYPSFAAGREVLDKEFVEQRGLTLALALVAWKLDHDGRYPEDLEALVPGLLATLPADPYWGGPFGYNGPPNPEPYLIHSVGPAGGGFARLDRKSQRVQFEGDLPFPLP